NTSMEPTHPLMAIASVDGRDRHTTEPVANYFSEYATMRGVLRVEVEYLIMLGDQRVCRAMTDQEKAFLRGLVSGFTLDDAIIINDIEREGYHDERRTIPKTNHDIKSIEYFLRIKIEDNQPSIGDVLEMVHFGLTSEDAKNLALGMSMHGFRDEVYVPAMVSFLDSLASFAETYKDLAMPARTHGQPASPTTLGKEMAVFLDRLRRQLVTLSEFQLTGKLNGATGNHNAYLIAAPNVPWLHLSSQFVRSLGLLPNYLTTQVEPGDSLVEMLQCYQRINTIMLDFAQDTWRYISDSYLLLKPTAGEVGSSTMPHKVNPIDFEHAEGALKKSNALLTAMYSISVSRLQRDLSDSTVKRDIGTVLAWSYDALVCLTRGLAKVAPNHEKMTADLEADYAVLTEAVQTVMRKERHVGAYDLIKDQTRGHLLTRDGYRALVQSLPLSDDNRARLAKLTPATYTGEASRLAHLAVTQWEKTRSAVVKQ
ncbi:MAG: adenylosuccinate lyase, partial [Candidatus Woesearchaeota archaeon]|nr:adenylosuccinate lyase [Candidatus Woesearchaeota archaeon]